MNHSSSALLDIRHLSAGFSIEGNYYRAVDDVSLRLLPGQVLGIVGESGCGKSVMSLSVMKLLPKKISRIDSGEIWFDGRNLMNLSESELLKLRGSDIGMVFQEPMTALNPVFAIGYQIEEVLGNHLVMSKKEKRRRSIELLKSVGIPHAERIVGEYPHQLSGGMRQRVMIAMAIACNPKLLIADEPTTALDVTIQAQIIELLKDIQQQRGMSMILITHDLGVVAEMADTVAVMYAGQIVEQGHVTQIFYEPKHPYLQLLLQSLPRLDEEQERLNSISGIVPSLVHMPRSGCRFAGRCPSASDDCRRLTPQLAEVGGGHYVRCLNFSACLPAAGEEETA
ncbi:ABC transporter ATP-binding protein [Paenibacillus sp. MZ04-78.2]|uniref:ABC transporter ATP-binding protein n=1 Tax=Paenibacillus sp. MZ04-78.2 TaxID=2962034 RepID=UPI0020B8582A|nr:ABC transporter ATP-binding protein [Paenibacillus sp. MZ04-78.2]MCP3776073.1 ABC transporter ATP-binding protein [Paenibacillus sp. MZ04-78.2]